MKTSIRIIGVTALGVLLAGCYSLRPAAGVTPELGSKIVFDVNDAGRVALGASMGAEIVQIEGRLLERTSEDYLISVSTVRFLRGGVQPWTGERVRLKPEFLGSTYERKFSRGRTIAATAITVGGFAALVASGTFGGFLGIGGGTEPPVEGLIRRP